MKLNKNRSVFSLLFFLMLISPVFAMSATDTFQIAEGPIALVKTHPKVATLTTGNTVVPINTNTH